MELPLIGNLFLWGLQSFRLDRLVRKTTEPFKKKKKKSILKSKRKDIFTLMQLGTDAGEIAEDHLEIPRQLTLGLLSNGEGHLQKN